MAKYRKKPIVIEAIVWDGSFHAITDFVGSAHDKTWRYGDTALTIELWNTKEECWVRCPLYHYIIKGIGGEFYPCDPQIFAATYEEAEE